MQKLKMRMSLKPREPEVKIEPPKIEQPKVEQPKIEDILKNNQDIIRSEFGKIEERIKNIEAKGIQDTETRGKIAKIAEDVQKQREKALQLAKEKEENDPNCPTCHGHLHRTITNGSRVKCTGPNCPKEYELVDLTSDLQCVGCGAPLKSDNLKNKNDGCPFCDSKKARKFNWAKVWKIPKAQ